MSRSCVVISLFRKDNDVLFHLSGHSFFFQVLFFLLTFHFRCLFYSFILCALIVLLVPFFSFLRFFFFFHASLPYSLLYFVFSPSSLLYCILLSPFPPSSFPLHTISLYVSIFSLFSFLPFFVFSVTISISFFPLFSLYLTLPHNMPVYLFPLFPFLLSSSRPSQSPIIIVRLREGR